MGVREVGRLCDEKGVSGGELLGGEQAASGKGGRLEESKLLKGMKGRFPIIYKDFRHRNATIPTRLSRTVELCRAEQCMHEHLSSNNNIKGSLWHQKSRMFRRRKKKKRISY